MRWRVGGRASRGLVDLAVARDLVTRRVVGGVNAHVTPTVAAPVSLFDGHAAARGYCSPVADARQPVERATAAERSAYERGSNPGRAALIA
jgi:hypothetical protein